MWAISCLKYSSMAYWRNVGSRILYHSSFPRTPTFSDFISFLFRGMVRTAQRGRFFERILGWMEGRLGSAALCVGWWQSSWEGWSFKAHHGICIDYYFLTNQAKLRGWRIIIFHKFIALYSRMNACYLDGKRLHYMTVETPARSCAHHGGNGNRPGTNQAHSG